MASNMQSHAASTGSAGSVVRDMILRGEKFYPGKTAVICGEERLTYQEFGSRIRKAAHILQDLGVKQGDRVAVMMLNCHRYLELYGACFEIGAIIVPLNVRLAAPEMVHTINDAQARLLVVDDDHLQMAERIRSALTTVRTYMYAGHLQGGGSTVPLEMQEYDKLIARTTEIRTVPPVFETDIAGLFYTSGTTGVPKGVMLTNRNIVANALQTLAFTIPSQSITFLHSIPMFHISGGVSAWLVFWLGGTHVVQQHFDPKNTFDLIKRERATQVTWAPTMITKLLTDPAIEEADFSSLERVNYGASPITPTHLRQAMDVFQCEFLQAYGTTEAAPLLTVLTPEDHQHAISGGAKEARRLLSCGREIPGVSVRVVDARGAEVGPDDVGEIIARGANLMSGYWRKPVETAQVFRDGWYYSGDMGKIDEDGYVYLVDRKRDMIISGGENIYSIEVENALNSHPAVLECAVVGVPDEYWGEAVKAFVVLTPGKNVTTDDLIYHCRTIIAGYKCPRLLDFVEELPKSGAGKVLKRELRDRHWLNRARKIN